MILTVDDCAYYLVARRSAKFFSVSVLPLFHRPRGQNGTLTLCCDPPLSNRHYQFSGPLRSYEDGLVLDDGLCVPRSIVQHYSQNSFEFSVRLTPAASLDSVAAVPA